MSAPTLSLSYAPKAAKIEPFTFPHLLQCLLKRMHPGGLCSGLPRACILRGVRTKSMLAAGRKCMPHTPSRNPNCVVAPHAGRPSTNLVLHTNTKASDPHRILQSSPSTSLLHKQTHMKTSTNTRSTDSTVFPSMSTLAYDTVRPMLPASRVLNKA